MKASSNRIILMAALLILSQDARAFAPNVHFATTTTTTTTLFAGGRDPQSMRVAEIKAELKELRVGCGDCFDKESLVTRLNYARANPPPPPQKKTAPAPPPRPQQQQPSARAPPRRGPSPWGAPPPPQQHVEFGAESDMNSDIDMDVFAQAGWTGEERRKGLSDVDHDRSPGLNRNFDELSTDDFKQSYRG